MERLIQKLERTCTTVSAVLMTIMLVIIISNVVLRYVFTSGINWAVEISDYTMIWSVLIASVALLCTDDHLSISVLEEHLTGIPKTMVKLIIYISCAVFGAAFVYSSLQLVFVAGNQTASTVRWLPMSYVYIVLPSAGLLSVVVCLLKAIVTIRQQFCDNRGNHS